MKSLKGCPCRYSLMLARFDIFSMICWCVFGQIKISKGEFIYGQLVFNIILHSNDQEEEFVGSKVYSRIY